ncbi:hypothetical protein N0V88_006367 [Collariella sp. IMI 366227]|nr:hypothetical protein N0V88_006367 [Collariella sp. IMI 366227]
MKSMTFVAAALAAVAHALPDKMPAPREWNDTENIAARQIAGKGKQQPIQFPRQRVATVQGCFKSSGDLEFIKTETFNTDSKCGFDICYTQGYLVGGSMGGEQCWCGNTYPPKADLVEDDNCNFPCTGYPDIACGGNEYWTIYNTGKSLVVKYYGEDITSSSSSAAPTSTSPPTTSPTAPQETTVTSTHEPENNNEKKGGTNVGGIVAGVVVGVVVIAGAAGGVFLWMRRKRNAEIEEEHRRNAAVSAFIGKPPGSSGGMSMSGDSRLDPVMAHRRMSDGSIADNQDYSRRILRVGFFRSRLFAE